MTPTTTATVAASTVLGGALRRWAAATARPMLVPEARVHTSAPALVHRRNPLKKFLAKTKKKFWYDSPTLGSQLLYKPSSLENVLKPQRKAKKEDTFRMRVLNQVLYKAITDLLNTSEVSPEVFDEKVEISKVQMTVDFSACRAYWVPSGLLEKDNRIQKVLEKYSPRVRHLLITHQVMGCVPPVVFVRDREQAAIAEVERLLEIADYGPEETSDISQDLDSIHGQFPVDAALKPTHTGPIPVSSQRPSPEPDHFGINHDSLNKQILEYKKKNTQRLLEANNLTLSQQHLEQIAQLKKLRLKKKKVNCSFDDITPEMYLLEKYSTNSSDTLSEREEELKELGEDIKELELEEDDPEDPAKIPKDLK
ncbi:putative ribosome-binding factor A, mitochondrial [Rhinoraja longicauda]